MTSTARLEELLNSKALFFLCVLCAALLSYGYEIFSFHLTIDEELHAQLYNSVPWAAKTWLIQGRWGMAILNIILLRQTILPVVSSAIGVAGVAGCLYFFLSSILESRIAILAGVIFGLSFPTLPFVFTFSTLAYGIGVGSICTAVFLNHSYADNYGKRLSATCFGAFAIAIYQPFVFVFIIIVLCVIFKKLTDPKNAVSAWTTLQRMLISLSASIMLYTLIDRAIRYALNIQIGYVQSFVDLPGLLANPITRLGAAIFRVLNVFRISPVLFGTDAALVTTVLLISCGLLFATSLNGNSLKNKVLRYASLIALLATLVVAEAITPSGVPLRSMIYVTFFVAAIIGLAVELAPSSCKIPLFILFFFATVDGAAVANRLFLSSDLVYAKDKQLAVELSQQIRSQTEGGKTNSVKELYIVGKWSWPITNLTPKTETFGASFFEWEEGNRWRIASIMRLNSDLSIGGATTKSVRMAVEQIPSMPTWPNEDSVKVINGLAIVKFGDFSSTQRTELCSLDIKRYCDQ